MKKVLGLLFIALVTLTSLHADNTANAEAEYLQTLNEFKESKRAAPFFETAYGYAIFPTVGKGAFLLGGSHGSGRVYVQGEWIANTALTQLTIGFQLGGQAFSQIMFFKDEDAFKRFKTGNFELSTQATAVAITVGVSADVDYDQGIIIFTATKGGFMYEASVGGQSFDYIDR